MNSPSSMSTNKRIAAAAALASAIAIPAEGVKLVPYYDPGGILTVCRGHTGPDVKPGQRFDLATCDKLLDADMREALQIVEHCVPGLPVRVLAAFGDAVYNIGPTVACDVTKSTAARLLAAGQLEQACRQLPRWNKARVFGVLTELLGLTKRRKLEMTVCLGDAA